MGKIKDTFRKFMGVEVLGGSQSFISGQQNGLDSLNRRQLLGEYTGIVFSCINVRSQEVAKYEPLLYVKNPRVVEAQDPLADHSFLQILDNPNPNQSKYELIELTQIYMDLTGEAFWYVEVGEVTRQPKAFYCVQPHRIKIAVDQSGHVIGYSIRRDDGVEIPLDVDEIIHFKYPDPLNPLRGKSPVGANLLYIDTEKQVSLFQHSFMKNSATPSGVATVKGGITVEAFKLLKKQWKEQQQGSHNAGKTLFIRNGDFTFDKVGLSLSELDMTALSGKTQDDVRKAFRVPKPKLGDTEGQGLGRDGAETVNYVFAKDVIDALQTRLDDTLQRYIRIAYKDQNLFVDHICQIPENETAELEEYKAKIQEWNLGVGRWLTVNAIEESKGLPLTPGGDQLYRTQTQIPIDETYIPPINNNLPKMVTRQTIVSTAKELPVKKTLSKTGFFDRLDQLEQATSKQYIDALKPMLQGQKKRILSRLKGNKALEDDLLVGFPLEEKKTILNIVEILLADTQKGGDLATEYIKGQSAYQIPETYAVALRDDTARVIQDYNGQTAQALRDTITEGLEKGENFEDLSRRVETLYDTAEGSRADRIARTETHRIINESVADAYQQSGITAMQWQTDGDACELCQAMDGTITDIGTPFLTVGDSLVGIEGKEYTVDYADVEAADLHPNCVLGDTSIIAPDTTQAMRIKYSGTIVELVTASGRRLSVTPNHIVLTSRGWVAAKNLTESDAVVGYDGRQKFAIHSDPTDNDSPPLIENIFASLIESAGSTSTRVPRSPEDFKGDAAFGEGDIDIISTDRFLRDNRHTLVADYLGDSQLSETIDGKVLTSFSDLASMLFTLALTPDTSMGKSDLMGLLGGGKCTYEQFVSLFGVTQYDTRLTQAVADSGTTDLVTLREIVGRFARLISFDKITDINVRDFDGHVYDLSTKSTLYIANTIISSNCNCKLVPVTPGEGNFAIEPEKVLVKIYDNEENDRLREALAKEQEFSLKLQEIIGLDDGA